MSRPVFKTGLAGITLAGEFDSLPPPPVPSGCSRPMAWNRACANCRILCFNIDA